MAKYKVKVISHLCKHNHMAKYGEIVDESQLTSPAYELVKSGFIELVDEKVEESEKVNKIEVKEPKQVKPKK